MIKKSEIRRRVETKKPRRQYMSFDSFRSTFWCQRCFGKGSVTDDKPDVNEGHKLSTWYACPKCNGMRITPEKEAKVSYKKYKIEFFRSMKKYETKKAAVDKALDKLKSNELNALYDLFTGYF